MKDFIKKYRLALIDCLLKDETFDLKIYFNSDLIESNTPATNWNVNSQVVLTQELPPSLLSECIKNKSFHKILNGKYILTSDNLDEIRKVEPDFTNISCLSTITWTDELLERFIDNWNWSNLSANHSIRWTHNRIETFINYVDFKSLSYNCLNISRTFIDKHSDKWNWEALSGNPSIAKGRGNSLFDNKHLVWKPKFKERMYWQVEEAIRLFDFNSNAMYSGSDISPSVSSNPEFVWTLEDFENHKEKMDFWVLAYYGRLDKRIILNYGDLLNENRIHHIAFHKYSDWSDDHPVYVNGWENLLQNKHLKIDLELLSFLSKKTVTCIYYTGDAREGFQKRFETKPVTALKIDSIRLSLSFEEVSENIDLIPHALLNETKIDEIFWTQIIKPELIKNSDLVKAILRND